jgi:hypothetical protein
MRNNLQCRLMLVAAGVLCAWTPVHAQGRYWLQMQYQQQLYRQQLLYRQWLLQQQMQQRWLRQQQGPQPLAVPVQTPVAFPPPGLPAEVSAPVPSPGATSEDREPVGTAPGRSGAKKSSAGVWVGSESLAGYGRLEFQFLPRGRVVMVDARETVRGSYVRRGTYVVLTFPGTATYSGVVRGNTLSGTARDSTRTWTWSVTYRAKGAPADGQEP